MIRCCFRNASFSKAYSFALSDSCAVLGLEPGMVSTAETLLSSWLALLSDSPCDEFKPRRVIDRFFNELTINPIDVTIRRYASLYDAITHCASLVEGGLITTFIPGFKDTPVFREYLTWHRTHDPRILKFLITFTRFGKKCEFANKSMQPKALRSWEGVEDRLSDLVLNKTTTHHIRRIIQTMLSDEPLTHFMGKHGGGAVAGPERGYVAKTSKLVLTPKLRRFYSMSSPLWRAIPVEERRWAFWAHQPAEEGNSSYDTSVMQFVPKTNDSLRSICMEPTAYMFAQQHVRAQLEHAIERGLMGKFVKIREQERNKVLALHASASGKLDTIDLSAASDSVSVDLVREVFPRWLLHGMLATRTSKVELPDGRTVSVKKFAPMGSAVCFPTQSIIFAAVVVYGYALYKHHGCVPLDFDYKRFLHDEVSTGTTSNLFETIAVYGDDIILDSRTTGYVIDTLSELGFIVNNEKSFFGNNAFRESCGVFAMAGEDVSPLSFKQKIIEGSQWDARSLASTVSLANLAGEQGYKRLHSHLVNVVLRFGRDAKRRNQVPFGEFIPGRMEGAYTSSSLMIYNPKPRNTHIEKTRYSPCNERENFMREEHRVLIIRPEVIESGEEMVRYKDLYEYHMFNRRSARGGLDESDFMTYPRDTSRGALGWAWMPA